MELFSAIIDAQPIGGVDNPYQGVRLFKVVAPVGAECLLAADVPWFEESEFLKASKRGASDWAYRY